MCVTVCVLFASSHHRITPIVDFDSVCVSVCLGARKKGSPDIPLSISFRSEDFKEWMDGRTDLQIPPVFYRTSSPPVPSGAAAQKGEYLKNLFHAHTHKRAAEINDIAVISNNA